MDKLEIKQGSFIQQTQYFIPVEIDLSVVLACLGIWFFHLSRRTTVIQDLLVRRQFSLLPDNRTNVNVEAWEKIFRDWPIRNKNCLWWPCLLMDWDRMSNLHRGSSIDASYQVSVYLAKWFQRRRFFRNRPIRNKNFLWQPCLLTDRDEMSNLYI